MNKAITTHYVRNFYAYSVTCKICGVAASVFSSDKFADSVKTGSVLPAFAFPLPSKRDNLIKRPTPPKLAQECVSCHLLLLNNFHTY